MGGEKTMPTSQRGRIGRPSAEEAASLEDRILAATWDLLLAKGARELSIEWIARAAAVSKKTIYTRFHDRSDLLMRLLRRKLELEESGLHEDVDAKDFRDAFCSCQPARKTDPLSAPNIDPTFRQRGGYPGSR